MSYPFRGLTYLLGNRELWRYAVLPGLVNFVVLGGCLVTSFFFVDDLAAWLRPEFLDAAATAGGTGLFARLQGLVAGAGRSLVAVLLYVLSFLLAAAGAVVTGLLSAAVLAGPLQELLSEAVERVATDEASDEPFRLGVFLRDAARGIVGSLQRLFIFGMVYVPLFALSVLPGIGLLGVAGTATYTCFFGALNFMSPTLDRRKLGLPSKIRWARGNLAPWMGFGAALLGLLLIPFVGLLLTPAFVTGGTLLLLDVDSGCVEGPGRSPA